MQIVVLLKPEAVDTVARAPQVDPAIDAVVRELGYSMTPVHPGTTSNALRRQFMIHAPDNADVNPL